MPKQAAQAAVEPDALLYGHMNNVEMKDARRQPPSSNKEASWAHVQFHL